MSSEELAGTLILVFAFVGLPLLGVRIFGPRRVLWFFVVLFVVSASIAFKSLGVIVGWSRHY